MSNNQQFFLMVAGMIALFVMLIVTILGNGMKQEQLCTVAGGVMIKTYHGFECVSGVFIIHNYMKG